MIGVAPHVGGKPTAASRTAAAIRFVLTHPVAMRIKGPLRDLAWVVRGAGIRNPRVPTHVGSVVFVCLGNICRSPFGALLAERLLEEKGRHGIAITSAGIRPSQAARSPVEACAAARAYGVALDFHVPQPLTREMVAAHDMVLVMEASQWHDLRASYPELRDRIFLLALYDERAGGAYARYNIADPFGQPPAAFEACYTRMHRALRRWLFELPIPGGNPVTRR